MRRKCSPMVGPLYLFYTSLGQDNERSIGIAIFGRVWIVLTLPRLLIFRRKRP